MIKVVEELARYESLFGTRSDVVMRRVIVRGEERYQVVTQERAWLFDNRDRATEKFGELLVEDERRYQRRAALVLETV